MSRNYSTNDSFYLNQSRVKAIVQMELQEFFNDIKDEIQYKIKQIDKNILQLKGEIRKIQQKTMTVKQYQPTELLSKLSQLQQKIEQIRIHKQRQIEKLADEIRNKSIDRSYDRRQQKSPLFRKSTVAPSLDLNNILFGDQNTKPNSISMPESIYKINEIKNNAPARPPLPKQKNDVMQQDFKQNYYAKTYEQQQKNAYEHQYKSDGQIQIQEKRQQKIDNQVAENLNKNKNSFMRKKSLKKIGTIPQQEIQQSILSNS